MIDEIALSYISIGNSQRTKDSKLEHQSIACAPLGDIANDSSASTFE